CAWPNRGRRRSARWRPHVRLFLESLENRIVLSDIPPFSTALELALAGQVTPANFVNPPSPIGTTSSTEANINTDVEPTVHNEPPMAANPTTPLNRVGTANDFQVFLPEGGFFYATQFSRARVTFNGGQTWTTYAIPFRGYTPPADPAVAFDADGTAY